MHEALARCRMCAAPPRANAAYCGGGAGCTNVIRLCQQCDAEFDVRLARGTHRKYCEECREQRDAFRAHQKRTVRCAWCKALCEPRSGARKTLWPIICRECLRPLRFVEARLRAHHVTIDRARSLLEDPGCEICGINMIEPTANRKGEQVACLVVDHDHSCCPSGQHSCGSCVRGLVCHNCNTAAGMVQDSPEIARRLADYLTRPRVVSAAA